MKKKKDNGIIVGIFIFLALFIFVIAVFTIGGRKGMFKESLTLYANFNTVDGIRKGAYVRLSGVEIGTVNSIEITSQGKVKLILKVDKELSRFIRKNSEASIQLEGLVGDKYVSITYGSFDYDPILDGDTIKTVEPFSLGAILQKAQESVDNAAIFTNELSQIFAKVNRGHGTLGKLLNDDQMYKSLNSAVNYVDTTLHEAAIQFKLSSESYAKLSGSIEKVVSGADSAITIIKDIMSRVQSGKGTIWALFTKQDLYDSLMIAIKYTLLTLEDARVGVSKFSENMEALKHNFLFKGYFENRGYWDRAAFEKQIDEKIQYLKNKEEEIKKLQKELFEKEKELKKIKE
jgi:phospholipid/cholesterol/gamma-HCH transport system substrate-binding protein